MTFPTLEITVGLFPGQGGYRRGALHRAWADGDSAVHDVLAAVDDAAASILHKDVSTRIFGSGAPAPEDLFVEDPEVLQLAIFAVSVATHRLLTDRGAHFGVLVGHSLGEIAALVATGAFSVRDGAELICHRIAATSRVSGSMPTGGMTSLLCDAERAGRILDLLGNPALALAVVNGPRQVVVSGPLDGLARVDAVAEAVGITAVRLLAPAAFHGPSMAAVRTEVLTRLPPYATGRLATPVFSPILGRFYRDGDDLVEMLSQHLVLPVRFDATLGRLHASGARVFVEVGAGSTLTGLVRAGYRDCATHAPLAASDETAGLERVAEALRSPLAPRSAAAVTTVAPRADTAPFLPPQPPRAEKTPAPAAVPATEPFSASPAAPPPAPAPAKADLHGTVRRIYADALEYPEEVFTDDAHLEADLGVDSVKRTELLAVLNDHFQLGPPPEDLRTADYETFGSVVQLMRTLVDGVPIAG